MKLVAITEKYEGAVAKLCKAEAEVGNLNVEATYKLKLDI